MSKEEHQLTGMDTAEPDLIRLKNYDGISLKQMAHDKTPFYKADLSTAIRESQNQVNGKYSFSLMKPIPQEMVSCLLSIAALH